MHIWVILLDVLRDKGEIQLHYSLYSQSCSKRISINHEHHSPRGHLLPKSQKWFHCCCRNNLHKVVTSIFFKWNILFISGRNHLSDQGLIHKGIFYSLKFINLSKVTLLRATRVCNQEDLCMLMTSFSFNNFSSPGKRRWTTLWGLNTSLTKVISYYFIYPFIQNISPFPTG